MSSPFDQPMRQSHWAILFILVNSLKMALRQLWPLFLIFVLRPKAQSISFFILFVLALLTVLMVVSLIKHFYYRFHIEQGHLILHQGWLKKTRTSIPLERIQSINLEQTLLHRLSKTARLAIETAGASGAEMSIGALDMDLAVRLRELLFQHLTKKEARQVEAIEDGGAGPAEQKLFSHGFLHCLKTGLSQNHLRTIGVVVAVGLSFLDDIQRQFDVFPEDSLEQAGAALESLAVLAALTVLAGVGVIAASVTRIMLRYADLALYFDGMRFRVHAGLITIREMSVSGRKLQYLTWSRNPLQRLFGLYRLDFRQAVPEVTSGQEHVEIPGVTPPELDSVLQLVFPEEGRDSGAWRGVDPRYFWLRWFWLGLVPGGMATGFLYWALPDIFYVGLLWPLWYALAAWQYTRRLRWYLNRDVMILRRGWLATSETLLPQFKVQRVDLESSPLSRRLGLCTVTLSTASGDLEIPWIPLEQGQRLRNWLLFRAEVDGRAWM
jgi:putative membrane protein